MSTHLSQGVRYTLFVFVIFQTLSVLNPLQATDQSIINDTDLAGPLIFCLLFGLLLLLVCVCIYACTCMHVGVVNCIGLIAKVQPYMLPNQIEYYNTHMHFIHSQSGKVQFGYIYGVSFLGCVCMWLVLNLMSSQSVSVSCVVSVLGYCLLPMVLLSCVSIATSLQ